MTRTEIRREIRAIADYLKSDLFQRVPAPELDGALWRSPLDWEVLLSKDEFGVRAEVRNPGGSVHFTGPVALEDFEFGEVLP